MGKILDLNCENTCYFQAISAPVISAVGERYYKVTAEALRVCGELVRVVRPNINVRKLLLTFDNCRFLVLSDMLSGLSL